MFLPQYKIQGFLFFVTRKSPLAFLYHADKQIIITHAAVRPEMLRLLINAMQ